MFNFIKAALLSHKCSMRNAAEQRDLKLEQDPEILSRSAARICMTELLLPFLILMVST